MGFTYLINECVEFRPAENLLINIQNTQQKISLSLPASRCLLLLIETQDLVTQNELFHYAWRDNAESTTPNNLYQNISLLRKALKGIAGHDNSWIITVPRKGFRLESGLLIEKRATTEDAESLSIIPVKPKPEVEPIPLAHLWQKWQHQPLFAVVTGGLLVAALILMLLVADRVIFPKRSLADSFVFYKTIESCQLYINKDARESDTHLRVLASQPPDCKLTPYIYITAYPILHAATLLSCNMPITGSAPHCISRLIRGFKSP